MLKQCHVKCTRVIDYIDIGGVSRSLISPKTGIIVTHWKTNSLANASNECHDRFFHGLILVLIYKVGNNMCFLVHYTAFFYLFSWEKNLFFNSRIPQSLLHHFPDLLIPYYIDLKIFFLWANTQAKSGILVEMFVFWNFMTQCLHKERLFIRRKWNH